MEIKTNILSGKKGLIMGVANNRSIAWGIAKACANNGAELAFTYQGDAIKKRVTPLAEELNSSNVFECDVSNQESIDKTFNSINSLWGELDFVVHAIGFSNKNELNGIYIEKYEKNLLKTLIISSFSFTSIAQRAEKLMKNGGSLLTLTYYGAEKVMPHYNVMGIAKAG